MDHAYKSQLLSYAMKQNMDLPVYATERQGPAHAPQFRCKVTYCGQTYQSQEFFPTLKAAEQAAAKVALNSLAPQSPEGIDVSYKNLLQEIAQKENSLLPVYATSTSGPSHAPSFTSTVEFVGKVFTGEEAKTKKLAEMNAAKLAYMSIKHGHENQTSSPSLPCEKQEAATSNVKNSLQEITSQSSKIVTPDIPSKWIEVYEEELPDVISSAPKAPATNTAKEINIAENPTNSGTINALSTIAAASSPSAMHKNPTNNCSETSSCVEEEFEKKLIMGTGHQSIPTGQHVVCRPWNPEMTLPQDTEMVFRDDKFIAYRLCSKTSSLMHNNCRVNQAKNVKAPTTN